MPSSAPDTAASRRIVLTTFGTHGDIVPFIGLAKELQALLIRPVLATSDFFRDLLTEHGVVYAPAAPNHSQHEREL